LERLAGIIAELEDRIRRLERQLALLNKDVDNVKHNERLLQGLKDEIDKVLAQKEGIRAQLEDLNIRSSKQFEDLSKTNTQLEQDNAEILNNFEE